MTTKIALLGSTGSIGRQTLEVVAAHPERFEIVALAAGANAELLNEQVRKFRPHYVAAATPEAASLVHHSDTGYGDNGLVEIAKVAEVDMVVVATAGKAGLAPTIAALEAGKEVALANKEVLVMAGAIVTGLARQKGIRIRPIDSEHSAVWQCLRGEDNIARLWLTASGGPFHRLGKDELEAVQAREALQHPTWQMGQKITIDSATLMNKGLEVIEAHWLFGVDYDRISVVLHFESIVHSLVEFADGSFKAQLGSADMRLPIQYALAYPDRLSSPWETLDLHSLRQLHFDLPDVDRFPALKLAYEAGRLGGTAPTVLAAVDEVAVELFVSGQIGFLQIPRLVEKVLNLHDVIAAPTLHELLETDAWARAKAKELGARS
jgi:1-deoxy-D-xylulose-5-phosphate reductoisomerase